MTNEIKILELEDVDIVDGELSLRIGNVELKHVFYNADDEWMKKEGTVGSTHNVRLLFYCLQVQIEDSGWAGVISSGHGDNEYDCFGMVLATGQDKGVVYFLLECDANTKFHCQIRIQNIEKDIEVGMMVKATGYFEASFVESDLWKAIESARAEWEALPEVEKQEREERFKRAMEKPFRYDLPSLPKSILSIVTRSVNNLLGRR